MEWQPKQLTEENWLEEDEVLKIFVQICFKTGEKRRTTKEERLQDVLRPQLAECVPIEVARLYDVARGAMAYGYFFYPLFTLGKEQLYRVMEAAARSKCTALGAPKSKMKSFALMVEWLAAQGVITPQEEKVWDAYRELRNMSSHPEDQSIFRPASALLTLNQVADYLNRLFAMPE